jgi:hypothetical protein
MWGREYIEWQDRTWRLLENKGQVEVDKWLTAEALAGGSVAAIAARRGLLPVTLVQGIVAGTGLGASVGTGAYMHWRYGVNRGRFPDQKVQVIAG